MNTKNDQLLGYCGLHCGNCLYSQNTEKGTGTAMGDGTITYCEGCNSTKSTPWCTDCDIKKCCREKEIRYCLQCSDYPCDKITDFINDTDYSYHKEVPSAMKRLDEIGLEAWSKEMQNNYTCKICGDRFTYFERGCTKCTDTN